MHTERTGDCACYFEKSFRLDDADRGFNRSRRQLSSCGLGDGDSVSP